MIFSDIGIFANIYRCHRVNMNRLSIPRDALVLVGDGQKALFLRNIGDEKSPNLTTERVFTDMNPPTREQGTDRPNRGVESAGGPRRSGMEMTDWHELEKHRFVDRVASALEHLVRSENLKDHCHCCICTYACRVEARFPDVKKSSDRS